MTNHALLAAPTVFFAQASAPRPPGLFGSGGSTFMVVWGLIIVGMYFLMIAPQRKKQKEHDKMVKELQSGDEVVTTSGIFGTITNVKDDRFVVRIADNTKVEVGKGFIQTVLKRDGSGAKS